MFIPQELIDRMRIPDITLFLKSCPCCVERNQKPKISVIEHLEHKLVTINCPNGCGFLGGKIVAYDNVEHLAEAWNNLVDSYLIKTSVVPSDPIIVSFLL